MSTAVTERVRDFENPQELHRLLDVMEVFRELDPEMPIQRVCYLLWTAIHQPCKQSEVGLAVGISDAARSRNKDILTDFHPKKSLGLLKAEQSTEDRRDNVISLTQKGHQFLKRVVQKLTSKR